MDAIRIQVIRGCDDQGHGGTVVDDATGVLGMLGETPILDLLIMAFQVERGLYEWANPNFDPEQPESESNPRKFVVTPLRNLSTQLRLHGERVLTRFASNQAAETARIQAEQLASSALSSLTIIENLP